MAFYLSPLVAVVEQDWSATVQAVSTAVGCIVLENTEKGKEFYKTLINNPTQLVNVFGKPTNNERNYLSMLTAVQALSQMNVLYCTTVKPADATYAGLYSTVENDPSTGNEVEVMNQLSSDLSGPKARAYDLKMFPSGNIDSFAETVEPEGFCDIISTSRGQWGNRIRIAIVNKAIYDGVVRKSDQTVISSVQYAQALKQLDIPLDNDYQFLVMVQYLKDISLDPTKSASWDFAEVFPVTTVQLGLDANGNIMYAESVINHQSQYIRIALNEFQKDQPFTKTFNEWLYFGGGSDGSLNANLDAEIIQAYRMYDNAEEFDVNIILDGGKSEQVKHELVKICEERKDCMCILDVPKELVLYNRGFEVTDLVDWRKGIGKYELIDNLNVNSDKAAVYANWCEVYDQWNRKYRWIPMSGFAAASWALTDTGNEPWFAPAGLSRGQVLGVRKLAFNPSLGDRDILYVAGLNPVVAFAKEGKVIWGQKTMLDSTSSFNRINVRRLFLILEKAIATYARAYLFEPNDEFTQKLIVNTITPYLTDVQARRGIYEFRVICDNTNNTPARIDRGELWCDIMIKPTRAAEFIVLRFTNTSTGLNLDEFVMASEPAYTGVV